MSPSDMGDDSWRDGDQTGPKSSDTATSRRNVLVGAGAMPLLLPWINGQTDHSDQVNNLQEQDGQSERIFYDEWDGGDYDQWNTSSDEGSYVDISRENPPDGGNWVLVAQHEEDRSETTSTTREAFRWDREWTLETLFMVETDEFHRGQDWEIRLVDEGVILDIGFSEWSEPTNPQLGGDLLSNSGRDISIEWESGVWYHAQCYHDGEGTYEFKVWPDEEEEPDHPAIGYGESPDEEEYPIELYGRTRGQPTEVRTTYLHVEEGRIDGDREPDNDQNEPDDDVESSPFDVTISEVTDPVQAGSELSVEAEIELAEETATATDVDTPQAQLFVDGEAVDSEEVVLEEDWTATIELNHEIPSDEDEGALPIRVEFLEAVDEAEVQVERESSLFDISITETTDPVTPGGVLAVEADIQLSETAVTADTDIPNATLFIDGDEVGSEPVTLDDDWTDTVEFTYDVPADEDADSLSLRVEFLEATATDTVSVSSGEGVQRLHPDGEINVQPETDVLFEVAATDNLQHVEWMVDDESAGISIGPWQGWDYGYGNAYHLRHTFDSTGSYEVTATAETDDGEQAVATWDVTVSEDGSTSPTIEARTPSEGDSLAPDRDDPLELEVSDSDEELDRVVWWLGHADVILDVSDIGGAEAAPTLSADELSECMECPVIVWVCTSTGAFIEEGLWRIEESDANETDSESDPATFNVVDIETNSPISGGETLEVNTTIRNDGDETGTTDVELIVGHDPQIEDRETLSLESDESASITLTFQAGQPAGEVEEFPIEVNTGADTASETVAVEASGTSTDEPSDDSGSTPATFNVVDVGTNSPVGGGELLTVEATIQNVGDEAGTTDVELIVGHNPAVEDSEMLTLEAGESTTLTLTFRAGQPTGGSETFPVVVDTGADSTSETVTVE